MQKGIIKSTENIFSADNKSTISFHKTSKTPDGSTIVYLPNIANPWPCCYYFNGSNYQYQSFLNQVEQSQNWVQNGNSLQFRDNNNFFVVSRMLNNVVRFIYGECYCDNEIFNTWPPPPPTPFPSVVAVNYGGSWFLRLTFNECSIYFCDDWTLNFSQSNPVLHPDFGTQSITVHCLSLPYIVEMPIHPVFVLHGYAGFIYEYDITTCNGFAISGTVSS